MKKSFMTRALATGLSLAMAFSLTAATNVTTAAAAAKPAMKASKMTVKEGKSRTFLATAKTLKTYKITKAKVKNASAKQYISVKKNAKGTGIVVTGKKGADTARKIVITFQNKKTKKTTTLNTKVVVKAAPVEKLTMTASVTGVKKIVVTFNKAVASKPAITLTKGNVKPAVAETVWNAEGTEATIKTAGKLTQGTYTVSTTVDTEALTASVVVEKDETLTSFALVGNTLKAKDTVHTTTAAIEYKALNQYGEAMNCSTTNVTIAPGKMATSGQKTPTATSAGKAVVEDIPTLYAIAGSEFNIVIVDTTSGVTLNTKAVYGASAKAAKVESVGLYNTAKGKIMDMTAGDKVIDYVALFKVTDQYGDPYKVTKSDVTGTAPMISAVAASGVTNVKVGSFAAGSDPIQTVDDVEYFAVPFTNVGTDNKAVAGDFSLTLVNSNLGIIGTPSYTVADSTLIASLEISADAIYAGQDNTMTYNATDVKGNTVTSYDALKGITFSAGSDAGVLAWSKNADGTAKLTYTAKGIASGLKSSIETFTATANPVTSSSYLVKTFSFTKLAQRKAVAVVGVSKDFATSTDVSGKQIDLKMKDLQIEDQYGNIFTVDELKANKLVSNSAIFVSGAAVNASAASPTDKWEAVSAAAPNAASGAAISTGVKLTAPATLGAITTSFVLSVNGKTNEGYTLKMSKIAASALKNITNLEIESINAGYTVAKNVTYNVSFVESKTVTGSATTIPIVVSGKVAGKKVYVTSTIADAEVDVPALPNYSAPTDEKTVTAKLTVLVSTEDGPVTLTKEFEVSNIPNPAGAKTIVKNSDYATATVAGGTSAKNAVDLNQNAYTSRDIYGNVVNDSATTKYTLSVKKVLNASNQDITKTAAAGTEYTITNNSMHSAAISVATGMKVTVNVAIVGTDINYDVVVTP